MSLAHTLGRFIIRHLPLHTAYQRAEGVAVRTAATVAQNLPRPSPTLPVAPRKISHGVTLWGFTPYCTTTLTPQNPLCQVEITPQKSGGYHLESYRDTPTNPAFYAWGTPDKPSHLYFCADTTALAAALLQATHAALAATGTRTAQSTQPSH